MGLRTKLLLILSAIVMGTAVSAAIIVYVTACGGLERSAERRLEGNAALLAELVQCRLDAELRKLEYWAAMPLVIRTALDEKNPALLSAFDHYFSMVVSREPYSSIFLINRAGDVVACDDPRRLYHPYARDVVSKKPDALKGFAGKPSIGDTLLSVASARPLVPLTAPVWHEGRVVAILRTGIDMGRLNGELVSSLRLENKERAFVFDPSPPSDLPEGSQPQVPSRLAPYAPPPGPLLAAFRETAGSVFRYRDHGIEYLAAFSRMRHPAWVFLATQPINEILAPVRNLRQATVGVVAFMLGLLAVSIFHLTAPVIQGIERCRRFAADIRKGRFDRRLRFESSDEVGQLARDLNKMATQLQLNRQALQEAEAQERLAHETEDLLLRTELEMLRYQINPHFLFNALNSIRELVIDDPSAGVQMIEALAAFCHASLTNRSGSLSTVAEELTHAQYYMKIQQVRFGERLQVEMKREGRVDAVPVPAFIIQPLVENAVKYGQKSKSNPLRVRIDTFPEGAFCVVKVANTGRWFEPDPIADSGTRLGLENVRRRLARYWGEDAGLTVEEKEGWVTVKVRFPIRASAYKQDSVNGPHASPEPRGRA